MTEIKPAEVVTPAPGPRIVTREGRVVIAFSIQSPTYFGLESIDTRRLIYFLHSEDAAIELKKYAGRRVIVTGEEFLDQRWKLTPILDVQEILVVP
jgi:beta-lactam-binding protein with PASTA domain